MSHHEWSVLSPRRRAVLRGIAVREGVQGVFGISAHAQVAFLEIKDEVCDGLPTCCRSISADLQIGLNRPGSKCIGLHLRIFMKIVNVIGIIRPNVGLVGVTSSRNPTSLHQQRR